LDDWYEKQKEINGFYDVISSTVSSSRIASAEKGTTRYSRLDIVAKPKKRDKAERFIYYLEGKVDNEYMQIENDMYNKDAALNTEITTEKVSKIDNKLLLAIIGIVVVVVIGIIAIITNVNSTNKLDSTLDKTSTELIESFNKNFTELMKCLTGE